jgi:hypothetical protein
MTILGLGVAVLFWALVQADRNAINRGNNDEH